MKYILDASAMVAFFRRETGWEVVRDLLDGSRSDKYFIHPANWIEVYYKMHEKKGSGAAADAIRQMRLLEVVVTDIPGNDFLLRVANIKVEYPYLSLGDSYAIALSALLDGTVVTSDKPFAKARAVTRVKLIRE
jgi:PIN domain nuclease of toxin-antitoxin system